jgi:hypothetical protein
MTIKTDNFRFLQFPFDRFHVIALGDHIGNIVFLFSFNMVECQYSHIGLTAIDAEFAGQILLDEDRRPHLRPLGRLAIYLQNILFVSCVAIPHLLLLAVTAYVLE